MSLKLSKNDVAPYDYISTNSTMTNPATCSGTLTKDGTTITTDETTLYLVATRTDTPSIVYYEDIYLMVNNNTTGITIQLSLNGEEWGSQYLDPIDCSESDVVVEILVRAIIDNSISSPLDVEIYADNIIVSCVAMPVVLEPVQAPA